MPMQIVNEDVERYMRALYDRYDEPALVEMEEHAREHNFPIVNRHVGVTLEMLARAIGAKRVFELGSGYGYSAYWFARAVGRDGIVHCTDGDPENAKKAEDYLTRAGLWERITFHVGDALGEFANVSGEWDIVYNDIDKHEYPAAWRAARDRVRVGGFYICDNVLWSGRVAEPEPKDDVRIGWTEAIKEQNALIAADADFISTILPIRDGVVVALRLK
jgi:predicted O-methyltransferase YrrM